MQKWELKRVYVRLDQDFQHMKEPTILTDLRWIVPKIGDAGEEDWEEAVSLAAEGWDLVEAVPLIVAHEQERPNISYGSSMTMGFYLIFKRPKP